MTKREMLLKKISTAQFAALDTQLFLDTHPGDEESVEKMKKYRDMAKPLIKEYEQKYNTSNIHREITILLVNLAYKRVH